MEWTWSVQEVASRPSTDPNIVCLSNNINKWSRRVFRGFLTMMVTLTLKSVTSLRRALNYAVIASSLWNSGGSWLEVVVFITLAHCFGSGTVANLPDTLVLTL